MQGIQTETDLTDENLFLRLCLDQAECIQCRSGYPPEKCHGDMIGFKCVRLDTARMIVNSNLISST